MFSLFIVCIFNSSSVTYFPAYTDLSGKLYCAVKNLLTHSRSVQACLHFTLVLNVLPDSAITLFIVALPQN